MKNETLKLIEMLNEQFDTPIISRKQMIQTCELIGVPNKTFYPIEREATKVGRGLYDISNMIDPGKPVAPQKAATVTNIDKNVTSITTTELHLLERDPTYVSWGSAPKVSKIIKSRQFFPVFRTFRKW